MLRLFLEHCPQTVSLLLAERLPNGFEGRVDSPPTGAGAPALCDVLLIPEATNTRNWRSTRRNLATILEPQRARLILCLQSQPASLSIMCDMQRQCSCG